MVCFFFIPRHDYGPHALHWAPVCFVSDRLGSGPLPPTRSTASSSQLFPPAAVYPPAGPFLCRVPIEFFPHHYSTACGFDFDVPAYVSFCHRRFLPRIAPVVRHYYKQTDFSSISLSALRWLIVVINGRFLRFRRLFFCECSRVLS